MNFVNVSCFWHILVNKNLFHEKFFEPLQHPKRTKFFSVTRAYARALFCFCFLFFVLVLCSCSCFCSCFCSLFFFLFFFLLVLFFLFFFFLLSLRSQPKTMFSIGLCEHRTFAPRASHSVFDTRDVLGYKNRRACLISQKSSSFRDPIRRFL